MEEISEIRNHVNFKNYGIAREKYELFKKKYPNFSDRLADWLQDNLLCTQYVSREKAQTHAGRGGLW